jgi:hypothetical protein
VKAYYGFTCTCETCNPRGCDLILSDARRRLINVLVHRLCNEEPPSWEKRHADWSSTGFVRIVANPAPPLTASQKTAYHILLAGLREAEGLLGIDIAMGYASASWELEQQITADFLISVIRAGEICAENIQRAVDITKSVREPGHRRIEQVKFLQRCCKQTPQVLFALDWKDAKVPLGHQECFGVRMVGLDEEQKYKVVMLTEADTRAALRKLRKGEKV